MLAEPTLHIVGPFTRVALAPCGPVHRTLALFTILSQRRCGEYDNAGRIG